MKGQSSFELVLVVKLFYNCVREKQTSKPGCKLSFYQFNQKEKICAQDFDEIEIAKLKSKGSEKEKIANCANHQPARKQSNNY